MIDRLTPIEDINFGCRAYNSLKRAGIDTLGEIADLTMEELLQIRNLGQRAAEEIIDKLRDYGLNLQGETGGYYMSYTTKELLETVNEFKKSEEFWRDYNKNPHMITDSEYKHSENVRRLDAISEIIREKEKQDIVRCKDCVNWERHTTNDTKRGGCYSAGKPLSNATTHEDHFCSYGTRKEQPND